MSAQGQGQVAGFLQKHFDPMGLLVEEQVFNF
jgi:hypothetical protein